MGNWYNLAKDKDFSGGADAPCSTATYTLRKDQWWNFWPVEVLNRRYVPANDNIRDGKNFLGLPKANARCTWGTGACNVKFWPAPDANY